MRPGKGIWEGNIPGSPFRALYFRAALPFPGGFLPAAGKIRAGRGLHFFTLKCKMIRKEESGRRAAAE
jgi:hypothetical protein